jgi:hypothetical protein
MGRGTPLSADTGSPDADAPDAASTRPCPPGSPDSGASCVAEGQMCSYGEGPQVSCRNVALCEGGRFSGTPAGLGPCLDPTPSCSAGSLDGGTCDPNAPYCAGGDGIQCVCQPCPPGGGLWACRQPDPSGMSWWHCLPPPPPPCPATAPNIGQPCAVTTTVHCFYLTTCASCSDGHWTWYSPGGDSFPSCF